MSPPQAADTEANVELAKQAAVNKSAGHAPEREASARVTSGKEIKHGHV